MNIMYLTINSHLINLPLFRILLNLRYRVPNDVVDRLETQTSAVNKLSLIKDLYELKYETSRLEQAANERTDFMESVIMPRLMTRIEQIEMADQEMDKKIKKLPTPFTKIKVNHASLKVTLFHFLLNFV